MRLNNMQLKIDIEARFCQAWNRLFMHCDKENDADDDEDDVYDNETDNPI